MFESLLRLSPGPVDLRALPSGAAPGLGVEAQWRRPLAGAAVS